MDGVAQFHQDTLVLRRAVLIAGGAFLLNHTLRTVYATAAVSVEPHGLGTAFSDGFVRRALTVYGLPGSVLETYCGTAIPFYPVNSGVCGAETAWQYDLDTARLRSAAADRWRILPPMWRLGRCLVRRYGK